MGTRNHVYENRHGMPPEEKGRIVLKAAPLQKNIRYTFAHIFGQFSSGVQGRPVSQFVAVFFSAFFQRQPQDLL
jgi:hypothetical protein